jgi:hypothetical protein
MLHESVASHFSPTDFVLTRLYNNNLFRTKRREKSNQDKLQKLIRPSSSKQPILSHLEEHLRRLGIMLDHLQGLPVPDTILRREAYTVVDARKTATAKEKW